MCPVRWALGPLCAVVTHTVTLRWQGNCPNIWQLRVCSAPRGSTTSVVSAFLCEHFVQPVEAHGKLKACMPTILLSCQTLRFNWGEKVVNFQLWNGLWISAMSCACGACLVLVHPGNDALWLHTVWTQCCHGNAPSSPGRCHEHTVTEWKSWEVCPNFQDSIPDQCTQPAGWLCRDQASRSSRAGGVLGIPLAGSLNTFASLALRHRLFSIAFECLCVRQLLLLPSRSWRWNGTPLLAVTKKSAGTFLRRKLPAVDVLKWPRCPRLAALGCQWPRGCLVGGAPGGWVPRRFLRNHGRWQNWFLWLESSRTDFISGGSPDTLIHGSAIPEWS